MPNCLAINLVLIGFLIVSATLCKSDISLEKEKELKLKHGGFCPEHFKILSVPYCNSVECEVACKEEFTEVTHSLCIEEMYGYDDLCGCCDPYPEFIRYPKSVVSSTTFTS
ncbi:hypothetical protein MKW94_023931 [Papaver nudicaule]|uniref:Uncharacterized protein n=1 Tax=Papaver nudicaule TaxID=74823 RepID=A0AA41VLM6_PAPNU|nr:hypothetical protein [Papaver nudicaule]